MHYGHRRRWLDNTHTHSAKCGRGRHTAQIHRVLYCSANGYTYCMQWTIVWIRVFACVWTIVVRAAHRVHRAIINFNRNAVNKIYNSHTHTWAACVRFWLIFTLCSFRGRMNLCNAYTVYTSTWPVFDGKFSGKSTHTHTPESWQILKFDRHLSLRNKHHWKPKRLISSDPCCHWLVLTCVQDDHRNGFPRKLLCTFTFDFQLICSLHTCGRMDRRWWGRGVGSVGGRDAEVVMCKQEWVRWRNIKEMEEKKNTLFPPSIFFSAFLLTSLSLSLIEFQFICLLKFVRCATNQCQTNNGLRRVRHHITSWLNNTNIVAGHGRQADEQQQQHRNESEWPCQGNLFDVI